MKRNLIKISCVIVLLSAMMVDANAQRRGARRPPANDQQQQQQNNNNPPTNYSQSGNIPYRVDSSAEGGLDTTKIRSLRQEGAFLEDTSRSLMSF